MRVEDLRLPRLLERFRDRRVPDEAGTTISLHPLVVPGDGSWQTLDVFLTLCRTSRLFVLDHEEFQAITISAFPAPTLPLLPPLPFPRTIFEISGLPEEVEKPPPLASYGKEGGPMVHYLLDTVALNERKQGEEWDVFVLAYLFFPDDLTVSHLLRGFVMRAGVGLFAVDGVTAANEWLNFRATEDTISLNIDMGPLVQSFATDLAQIANARGVTVESRPIPRTSVRRAERYRYVHPQTYFVYVSDEVVEAKPGRGERRYHVRFLRRGHWTHRYGQRFWTRAHIVGDPGAPWKGDPVHVLSHETPDEAVRLGGG